MSNWEQSDYSMQYKDLTQWGDWLEWHDYDAAYYVAKTNSIWCVHNNEHRTIASCTNRDAAVAACRLLNL